MIDAAALREIVLSDGPCRALYQLCADAPPATSKRPPNLRWILWDAGHYGGLAQAYAAGLAGKPANPAHCEPLLIFGVAWLAGADALARARAAEAVGQGRAA